MRSFLFAIVLFLAGPALALNPEEMLDDPGQEERAQTIGKELRCVVCQNQSINESDADLARDLRRLVRDRISAGETDEEVIDHIVARYGDFVLLRPPVKATTYLLWATPVILLLLGGVVVVTVLRRGRTPAKTPPLSDAERERARKLLGEDH